MSRPIQIVDAPECWATPLTILDYIEHLRALIKEAEWCGEPIECCPWCGVAWRKVGDAPKHTDACPAFTPEGEVR